MSSLLKNQDNKADTGFSLKFVSFCLCGLLFHNQNKMQEDIDLVIRHPLTVCPLCLPLFHFHPQNMRYAFKPEDTHGCPIYPLLKEHSGDLVLHFHKVSNQVRDALKKEKSKSKQLRRRYPDF